MPKPSIASTSHNAPERRVRVDDVAVDGLGSDDDRPRLEAPRAGDADVEDEVVPPLRESVRRRKRRLDRADPAAQLIDAIRGDQLALRGGNQQHAGHARPRPTRV
jgi:hypothetical protein